jgi:hypothetical protein
MIRDRIDDLLVRVSLMPGVKGLGHLRDFEEDTHKILNHIDSAIGADTEWLFPPPCSCHWHFNTVCQRRRAVGARVRMLEELLAR